MNKKLKQEVKETLTRLVSSIHQDIKDLEEVSN